MGVTKTELEVRLMSRVERDEASNCWIWSGEKTSFGHGRMRIGGGKRITTHRLSYELFVGEIPSGMLICHHCDNPACVNPSHLFVGTSKDNAQDMVSKGRNFVPLGEKCGMAKLTREQVCELRTYGNAITEKKISVSAIARLFKISRRNVGFILKGETWA